MRSNDDHFKFKIPFRSCLLAIVASCHLLSASFMAASHAQALATNAAPKAKASNVWFTGASADQAATPGQMSGANGYVDTARSMAVTAFYPLFVSYVPASMAPVAGQAYAPLATGSLSASGEAGKALAEAFAATVLMTSLLLPPLPATEGLGVDPAAQAGTDSNSKIAGLIAMWRKNQEELGKLIEEIDEADDEIDSGSAAASNTGKPEKTPLQGLDENLSPGKKPGKTTAAKPPKKEKKKKKKVARKPPKPKPSPAGEWKPFEATAYCSCTSCCGKSDGITASGKKVHWGTLAVPSSIPFGRKFEIRELPGMTFVAEDRGGAITGGRIDIWHSSHSKALAFGRRSIRMRVVR